MMNPSEIAHLIPLSELSGEALRQAAGLAAAVTLKTGQVLGGHGGDSRKILLAELKAGQGFGEEALISGDPRNATVTMASAGELMRLPAAEFDTLLREPLVQHVSLSQGAELIKHGAKLIDVRLEAEFAVGSLKGSINLPLYLLRLRANKIDLKRPCILFCQSGRRSSAAAFLLAQRGFDSRVLEGGLDALSAARGAQINS